MSGIRKAKTQQPRPMTGRERILAALRREPVDRIPFVPLIDPYVLMGLPPGITQAPDDPVQGAIEAAQVLSYDPMIRHVPVTEPRAHNTAFLEAVGCFSPPVTASAELKDDLLIETLTTPVGTLTGLYKYGGGGWVPHPIKHLVNNYAEMRIFHYAVDHLSPEPLIPKDNRFLAVERELGDDGIATASIMNTPLMYLIEMVWGLESTYYLLQDHREEVEDILEKLHHSLKQIVKLHADSPAQVIIEYENTSSTLLSPAIFRRYYLPYHNEYSEILEEAGKIFLIHMCGRLRAFVDDFRSARFTGIADISPHPTGDLPLDDAAALLQGKVVLGGIDATTFVNTDAGFVRAEVSSLIERVKSFSGVLLGSADATPRGTLVENFWLIRDLVNTVGSYI